MKLNFNLIVILLILLILIIIFTKNNNKNSLENVNKCCIAILTRGYSDIRKYEKLIKRNKNILSNLCDKSIDNLIFHEGNITKEQQLYIKNQTPELKLIFIDISDIAFKKDKQNIKIEEEPGFQIGYRHMCSFWFVSFFEFVKKYDKLLRIDEDCFIESSIDTIFSELDTYLFVCAYISDDNESVTKGLNTFSLEFLENHKEDFKFKKYDNKKPYGPYTNLIGFSLDKIRNNNAFEEYKNAIDQSDMIYKRRWGDLPLWGEVIYYIFGEETLKVDKKIKYFHDSHGKQIN